MKSRISQSAYQKASLEYGSGTANSLSTYLMTYDHLLRQLQRAEEIHCRRRVRVIQNRIFRSFAAKLVCLIRCLDHPADISMAHLKLIAATLDPGKDCGEKIRIRAEPKSSGQGWRPICSFGLKRQACQRLVADVLTARFGIDEIDYLTRGKGAERASDRIVELFEKDKFSYFVTADIQNCFRSVENGSLAALLGLPENVVMNSIRISPSASLSIVGGFPPSLTYKTLVGAVQSGLPQGSRASQVVAAILLGPTLRQVTSADRALFLGDDIAIAAHQHQEAVALKKALVGALSSHPAGPFRLKHCDVEHVGFGFNFLQYRHRRDPFVERLHRRPAAKSYEKYKRKVISLFKGHSYRDAFRHTARYRWHWMRSFRRWEWNSLSKLGLWQNTIDAMDQGVAAKKLGESKAFEL